MAKIVFEWKKSLLETGTKKTGGRKGLFFLASAAERFMQPYVPADQTGTFGECADWNGGDPGADLLHEPICPLSVGRDSVCGSQNKKRCFHQWGGAVLVTPEGCKDTFREKAGIQ